MSTYDDHLMSARAELAALLAYAEETRRYCMKNGRTRHATIWEQRADKIRGAISNVDGIPGIGAVLAETTETMADRARKIRAHHSPQAVSERRQAARAALIGESIADELRPAGYVELVAGDGELAVRLGDPIVFDPTGRDLIRYAVVGIVIDCDEEAQEPGEQPAPIVRVNDVDDDTTGQLVVVRRAFAVLTAEGA